MLSLYVDGDSPLHRCPAGWKMGVFAVWVLALTLLPASVGTAGAAVIGAVVAYLVGFGVRRGAGMLAADLHALWIFYAVLFAAQWLFLDLTTAALTTARVLGVVLTAQVMTRTTRIADMAGVAEALLTPVPHLPWVGPPRGARRSAHGALGAGQRREPRAGHEEDGAEQRHQEGAGERAVVGAQRGQDDREHEGDGEGGDACGGHGARLAGAPRAHPDVPTGIGAS